MGRLIVLVVIDIAVIVAVSIVVGAWAPRWRGNWLDHDHGPLHRLPWETPGYFRALHVSWLARRLPEMGETFGGASKGVLPGRTAPELRGYLREVRRAEWVHWASIASAVVLVLFNPWWLAVAFMVATSLGNVPFMLVLRSNRFRLERILLKEGGR